MTTILDAGRTQLSNADVLLWVRNKRAQHAREDAEDKDAKRQYYRPKVFMNSLRRQEQELTDDKYPYVTNAGAYEGAKHNKCIKLFIERVDEDICNPLEDKYKDRGLTHAQIMQQLGKEYQRKTFTLSELLMIHNMAPENVSMLEMVLEGWQDRFSPEEMETLLEIVHQVFRCGDQLPSSVNGKVS